MSELSKLGGWVQETESHAGMGKESLIKQEDSYKLLCALEPIQDVNFRLGIQNKVNPDHCTDFDPDVLSYHQARQLWQSHTLSYHLTGPGGFCELTNFHLQCNSYVAFVSLQRKNKFLFTKSYCTGLNARTEN